MRGEAGMQLAQGYSPAPDTARTMSPIENSISMIRAQISALSDNIDKLYSRLDSLLGPTPPQAERAATALNKAMRESLASDLQSCAGGISYQNERIDEIFARLEL
jgi:hypothetical protein